MWSRLWIVFEGKLLLHAVFLVDESGGIDIVGSVVGHRHQCGEVVANLIRSEIDEGQVSKRITHHTRHGSECHEEEG